MMDREDEAQELPAGGGEGHEEAIKLQKEGTEEDENDDDERVRPKKFWITELPDPEDTEFRKYTHRTPVEGNHDPSIYEPGDEQCSMWESHPNHECYSPFGDGGTTATVNAFGQLMQFSTYLGPGKSGMFSVDHTSIYEPWLVWGRANQLDRMSRAHNRDEMTYGVYFPDLIVEDDLVRKYVHCRWPRYEYESEKAKLVNQWMVHDGVVLQQWRFTNLDTEKISTKVVFSKDMLIRDLQYQEWDHFYGIMGGNYHFLGPGNYSWICLHELVDNTPASYTNEAEAFNYSIGVTVFVFIDGVAIKFDTNEEWTLTVKGNQTREFVVAYKLIYSTSEVAKDWKQFLVAADETNVKLAEDGLFEHGYMANGKRILENGELRHANEPPRNSLTDTAFQIIKAGEFAEHYSKDPGKNEWQLARQCVGQVYKNWITHLDELDGRGKFAWPRSRRGEFGVFRLDDHVWAIRALKIAESMVSPNSLEGDIPERTTGASTRPTKSALAKEYSFANTQREVVQRFTTQNPNYQSKKRMLAVTRSVRESRFLFHARDTALFYNVDQVKWRGTQFIELLKKTIDSQPHHVDNEESGWDDTLRYALAITMGTDGYKINAKSSFELVQSSIDVLFGSFSSNGFVPGQLDKDTKEQALFEDEEYTDSYYHASFEIPYILLQYASRIHSLYKTQLSETTISGPSATVQLMTDLDNPQHTEPQRPKVADAMRAPANLNMKKTTPFNDLIDITNIVDRDDEWLYNYPSIFSRKTKIDLEEARKSAKAGVNYSEIGNGIVRKELDNWEGNPPDLLARWNHCFVVDVQQTKFFGRSDEPNYEVYPREDNLELWERLSKPRTPEQAKKRLIRMPLVQEFQAALCYLATPEIYQMSISSFFDRHVKNESYFLEDTALIENAWETEFHLSFYSLIHSDSNHAEGIATSSAEEFPGSNQKKKIAVASMGFRFDGDIFDRYWTGYLLENVPGLYKERGYNNFNPSEGHQPLFIKSNNKAYRQRKVLELQFFDRMIQQIVRCTQEISYSIREELGMKQGALSSSILSSDDYFTSSVLWNRYQHILHVVEEELESAIGVIGKWEKREDDRKGEEPRWTRNDEMKYRGIINKSKGSTKRRVIDLHVAYRSIKTLRETIENSQDQIRNDLSLQGSEKIRFFTYVTVVFLPLGFATGIFSMSGAPDGKVLGSMAVCAVVAILLTVLALLNAKQLAKIVDDLFSVYHRYSQGKMERSLLVKGKKERRSIPEDIEEVEQNHNRVERTANSHDKKRKMSPRVETWTLLFWIHYFKFMVFQLTPSPEPTQDSDVKYKERLNMLIHPPDVARPVKPLINKLKARRENEELEKKSKKKNGHEERAPDNENNYV
ncbi:uncharacterized protein EAE97_000952 [Botrytis byssoidea]|uniref:Mg2+ transporter zinc transport protein n=1 Tax=Botrytis byssoidea TaxID=139641 RepID=A0A9P5IZ82_9HELO|nr:uncharacterized protein EAE97_000952 [Botrytis byssoidea]KAF7953553.1 hypothetical protein EAE97_000952 [Botrytis byssoidea]